jgi:glutamine amidotransferase
MSTVAIIDYGMGNLHSIAKALQHAEPKVDVQIVTDQARILSAERVVFPGVGAIRDCMHALESTGLADVIREVAQNKPMLGICLGMQALLTESEENETSQCLNIIPGQVVHFEKHIRDERGEMLKIPHMGWNQVHQQIEHPIWENITQDSRFYFVHSYYARPFRSEVIAATSAYPEPFSCALSKNNIFAVQFHPEKSQADGLQLLKNFLNWDGSV